MIKKGIYFVLSIVCYGLLIAGIEPAEAKNFYTVENVKVDIQAENPVTAREQAFSAGQLKAFKALAKSLGKEGAEQNIDPATLSGLIKDFEIADEQLAPERYAVTYVFRFKRAEVERMLLGIQSASTGQLDNDVERASDIPMMRDQVTEVSDEPLQGREPRRDYSPLFNGQQAESMPAHSQMPRAQTAYNGRPILVLPYWREGSRTVLWGSENMWTPTWKRLENTAGSSADFVLPLGDLADMREVSDTIPDDPAAIRRLLSRYQVSKAIVAVGQNASRGVTSTLYVVTPRGLAFWKVIDSPYGPQRDPYSIAAGEILREVSKESPSYANNNQGWQRDFSATSTAPVPNPTPGLGISGMPDNVQNSARNLIIVESRFQNPQQWLQMKSLLYRVSGIREINIVSIKPQSAVINMELSEPIAQIRQNLQTYNLDLQAKPAVPAATPTQAAAYRLSFRSNGV